MSKIFKGITKKQWLAWAARNLPKKSEMFPNGRTIFYEGDDPEGFAREIQEKFGFDVTNAPSPSWSFVTASWTESYSFHCPAELLDKIDARSGKYPIGS